MLTCLVKEARGLVRVSGVVPNGVLFVQRQPAPGGGWFTLRGGSNMAITNQGFTLEDSEPPLGVPVTYRALSTPSNRLVQRNLINSPDFSLGVQSWTAGTGRTLSLVSGKGHVTSFPAGFGGTTAQRVIAEVAVSQLLPSTTYLVTGMIKFVSPSVWTWQDVKNVGTWQQLKDAKATWADVLSSVTGGGPAGTNIAVYASLGSGATDFISQIQVLVTPMTQTGQWQNFSVFFTTPATVPANARLRLSHGPSNSYQYAVTWDLDQFSIMTAEDAAKPYRLYWFNGNTAVPDRPQDYLMQDSTWEDFTKDAAISWEGIVGNSASKFLSPSRIYTLGTCQINVPATLNVCEPVLLSDPVSSGLSQWFGLAEIGTLTMDARSSVLAPLGRDFYVNSSSVRGSARGTLTLFTNTLAERAQALLVFASGRVLLLRNPNPAYPETLWYLAVGDVQEERTLPDARRPERTWTVPFVTVERPTGLIEASTGVLWQQIKNSGESWFTLRETRDNWLEVLTEAP